VRNVPDIPDAIPYLAENPADPGQKQRAVGLDLTDGAQSCRSLYAMLIAQQNGGGMVMPWQKGRSLGPLNGGSAIDQPLMGWQMICPGQFGRIKPLARFAACPLHSRWRPSFALATIVSKRGGVI
jgi:hypothetical protein